MAMDESGLAGNVAQAMVAALDWSSSPDARKAAVSYLDSIKAGDVRILAKISFLLVRKDWSSEIRLQAFKLLQHLVRLRWEELSSTERRDFASVAINLLSDMANPCEEWALKSQSAALAAEIVRREGLEDIWKEFFLPLASLANTGPAQAELVAMTLRWLPEDITVHNEDLEGERRRMLLRGLTLSLVDILPLLYNLLERHFGAAVCEANKQQLDIAKQHAAAVTASLNAVNAYSEWAPLPDLASYGLINGCGFFLSSPDFRLHACEFFKVVSQRKRPIDDSATAFDSAMRSIFQILMNVSGDFLHKSSSTGGVIDESELEFAEILCESMVSLGSSNLQCISSDDSMLSLYLDQMLGYFRHFKFALHRQSLLFWVALMRELVSKPKVTSHSAGVDAAVNSSSTISGPGQVDKEKKGILVFINHDVCTTILDVSFQRMLKKEKVSPGTVISWGVLELWTDEYDSKGDFSLYRSRLGLMTSQQNIEPIESKHGIRSSLLYHFDTQEVERVKNEWKLELIRFIASHNPLVAAARVCDRIDAIIKSLVQSQMPAQDLATMEGMRLALETVVCAIFDGSNEFAGVSPEVQLAICKTFEGFLQQLLSLKWREPALAEELGRYLDALGPFLKYFPDAVVGVINKLFELLTSLPFNLKDPLANRARHARLQICSSFIRIAKTTDKVILPHMKGIADTMGYLQKEGLLLRGEHNLLGEAFLVMASAAGIQQQQEVLVWLLEPLSKQWTQMEWQNTYLSDPTGLVRLCSDTSFMWSIFHAVTFFEKALKRSGIRKSAVNAENVSPASNNTKHLHPMTPHLSWILPPLLKLLRALHALWSPPIAQSLPGELKAAMGMSDIEQTSLLGEGNLKSSKGRLTFADASQVDINKEGGIEPNENDVRNWLKGIRDSGYNVLGLSATLGDPFFRCMEGGSVSVSLIEHIQSMEFRHAKLLIHLVVIPLIKFCPSDLWEDWNEKILQPLLLHCNQALNISWSSLLHEGRAKVPDIHDNICRSDLKVEVMEEKLLRDLTREICSLLSVLATPTVNIGLPSLEQFGHVNRVEAASLKDLHAFASSSIVAFLLTHKGLALPALQICIGAFTWTDGEAVAKISSFCGSVILLAISTNDLELHQFVGKDLFCALIQGLTLESNAVVSADLVGLCREIFVYLADRDPAPRQVLLSLPCTTPPDLQAFEEALAKTSSPKEQKQHMKSFLLLATGNKLRALATQKSTNVITNVSLRTRNSTPPPEASSEGDVVGLASII